MNPSHKILCKYYGGSISYGLNTPSSDLDIRLMYINTEIGAILGLQKDEQFCRQNESEDIVGHELKHFLKLLRQANTQSVEMLFNQNWIEVSEEFSLIQSNKGSLVDSEKLFSSVGGFLKGEKNRTFDASRGEIGKKRRVDIEKYGFSYRNLIHCIRLGWSAHTYFQKGVYPVMIKDSDPELANLLLDIKLNPSSYTKDFAEDSIEIYENLMLESFNNRRFDTKFDENLANDICLKIYGKIIQTYL